MICCGERRRHVGALNLRRVLAGSLVVVGLTCSGYAQGAQTPGGGQTQPPPTPAPTPNPQPQPRQPDVVIPTPQPSPDQNNTITLRGRIIAGAHELDGPPIEIRFETD